MHLKYCLMAAFYAKETRHAQEVMKSLGIQFQNATPQSLYDQWWFWNCTNIPSPLPEYLSELKCDPMDCIGYGLSKQDAEKIANHNFITNGR
jgi:hypothetical protein